MTLWDMQPYNSTLTAADMRDFSEATQKVYELMKDGEFHDAETIIATSGIREGLRRLRELRTLYTIEKRRNGASRNYQYRLLKKENE
jgi:hypothetical protein